ncbi:hypothetical protein [Pseudomonas sp. SO81]|uniref:hypothetical protein n=1 Tax=Pseudomonas sp. SO81 TaxID=2983246 RepID=UPI0025A337B5|nr:hypothetical protein [Pseudomonas sp. SO81]WJN61603.1 hypothetical protein OH686_22935 [Pseudomonas sp. SO81]
MKTPADVIKAASPEVRAIIEEVLKINQEGKHYKALPAEVEREFCERIITVIKGKVKV